MCVNALIRSGESCGNLTELKDCLETNLSCCIKYEPSNEIAVTPTQLTPHVQDELNTRILFACIYRKGYFHCCKDATRSCRYKCTHARMLL